MRYISLYFFRFSFSNFGFRFRCNHATGLSEALHSYLYFFLHTGSFHISVFLILPHLSADVDSCDEDGDEADEGVVEEELADIPGTTSGT